MFDFKNKGDFYNEYYFRHSCGLPYQRDEHWLKFFDAIADRIVREIRPQSALDAGCAMGFLIEALRKRGIEAFGVDISEYAVANIPPEIRPYCWVGSVTEPFPRHYDLIVCIEVLEHLLPMEAEQAVENFCRHAEDVLFSSTPTDFKEPSHVNVQPPEYWAELFSRYGFYRDFDFDASFITPWAVRFKKRTEPLGRLIVNYERRLWWLAQENKAVREQNIEQCSKLAEQESQINVLTANLAEKDQMLKRLESQVKAHEEELVGYQQKAEQELELLRVTNVTLKNELERKDGELQRISAHLAALQDSLPLKILARYNRWRQRFLPEGSRRYCTYRLFMKAAHIIMDEGSLALMRKILFRVKNKRFPGIRTDTHHVNIVLRQPSKMIKSEQIFHVQEVVPAPPPLRHYTTVDIVICIHNALEYVKKCLESIVRYTYPPYILILIDDGSDQQTASFLKNFALSQGAVLIRNDQAKGYTFAANQGLRQSSGDYVVLLNSDTVVGPDWLDKMIACAETDPCIGIVGPLSNTASWQSIPRVFNSTGDDWAENSLPEGITVADMAKVTAKYSDRIYPSIPFLNGFCLLIKRKLIEEIGYFDEKLFGQGYGEENDYCLRAYKAGWKLVIADDVYVYHWQSKSYSDKSRKELAKRANDILIAKYGREIVEKGVTLCRDRVMEGIRARSQVMLMRQHLIEEGKKRWEGKRLLFILPIAEPGGGGNVIFQEARAMQEMGVDARILNLSCNRSMFELSYPNNTIPTTYVDRESQIPELLGDYDAVVATLYQTVYWLEPNPSDERPLRGYYIQDFEPLFFSPTSEEFVSAWNSYTYYSDLIRFTKTEWNRDILQERIGVDCFVVGPSVDIDLFRPRPRKDPEWPERPLRIAAMIRPNTPRRAPELTMEVLTEIYRFHGNTIEIVLFGCHPDDPDFHRLACDFPWRHAGILTPTKMAFLLNEVDIFVDFSSHQAMGLTAMEAMACGAAVIVPSNDSGTNSFGVHERNCLMVDTRHQKDCVVTLQRLIIDSNLRSKLQRQAIFDICQFYPERAAYNILATIFKE